MEGVEEEGGFRVKTLSSFHYSNGPILAVCLKEGSSLLAFFQNKAKISPLDVQNLHASELVNFCEKKKIFGFSSLY